MVTEAIVTAIIAGGVPGLIGLIGILVGGYNARTDRQSSDRRFSDIQAEMRSDRDRVAAEFRTWHTRNERIT